MFYFALSAQCLLFLFMVWVWVPQHRRAADVGPALLFVLLHIFFYYLLPQLAMATTGRVRILAARPSDVLHAQALVALFIAVFGLSRVWVERIAPRAIAEQSLDEVVVPRNPMATMALYTLSAVGILCLVFFALQLQGVQYRSEGVASLRGQLLFAGSLLCHFYVVLTAFKWWRGGNRLWPVALILITGMIFLYLGGRARALLIFVYFLWLVWLFRLHVSMARALVGLAVVVAVIPIFAFLKGLSYEWRGGPSVAITDGWQTIGEMLVNGNMAPSFRSLAQIASYGGDFSGTPGTWFMQTFYAEVYAKGVGFHLGMIGEAYMLGGAVAVCVLACVAGAASCLVDRRFGASRTAAARLCLMIAATYGFAIGWNFLDSFLKALTALLGPALWVATGWAAGIAKGRSSTAIRR